MSGQLGWAAGLVGIGLASCSGGGSSPSVSVGFESVASGGAEGTVAQVVLALRATKGPLTDDLEVTLVGTGTSLPGIDHDFDANRSVTFPSGSVDGATRAVSVNLTGDSLVEGADETLILTLSSPTFGGLTTRTHTLTVAETDFAQLAFVGTVSATTSEAATHTIDVELILDPGDVLGLEVDATVVDAGNGVATSGVDYQPIAAQVLSFPAGSSNGMTLSISLTPLDDAEIEGDESLVLLLQDASAGAQITNATHSVTITDDDIAGSEFLVVHGALSGGAPTQVTTDDSFDLGNEQVGSGPNEALVLTLQNAGAQPLELEPLRISGDSADFSVELGSGPAPLPVESLAAFPFSVALDDAVHGACLNIDADACTALTEVSQVVLDDVPLPGGGAITLALERLPTPFAADVEIRVDGVRVAADELLDGFTLWRGRVLGYEHSEAFLSFSPVAAQGWVRLGDGLGSLHLTTESSSGAPIVRWLWEDQLAGAYTGEAPGACQGARLIPGLAPPAAAAAPAAQASVIGLTLPECRLAIETDNQFYAKFGDTTSATQYVTQLIAAVSDVYERDTQTTLSIVYLGIHTDPNDGWSTPEMPGADAGDLLDEFQAAWLGNLPGGANLAHFISGAALGGGVAYISALCNSSFGFGVSGSVNGNIDWSGSRGPPNLLTWDFVVVAHELGHNFGSSHTQDYCPPLDTCFANCDGVTNCVPGTLMSYCHVCAGIGNLKLEFHPFVAERIRATVAGSCLPNALLAAGATVSVTVSFEPSGAAGSKAAELELRHTAPNETSPFLMNLSATSSN